MASLFKNLRAQSRQRIAESPFDSHVNIKNYEELEVVKPDAETKRKK